LFRHRIVQSLLHRSVVQRDTYSCGALGASGAPACSWREARRRRARYCGS